MRRGLKPVTLAVEDRTFVYMQPGWWCSLDDADDHEGQLVDEDNQIAQMARRSARHLARGEAIFAPVVIRATRLLCGLTQREAGLAFGGGEKSFEKYESGEIEPSGPMKRLLKLAMLRPDLFRKPDHREPATSSLSDLALARETLKAVGLDAIYGPLLRETNLSRGDSASAGDRRMRA